METRKQMSSIIRQMNLSRKCFCLVWFVRIMRQPHEKTGKRSQSMINDWTITGNINAIQRAFLVLLSIFCKLYAANSSNIYKQVLSCFNVSLPFQAFSLNSPHSIMFLSHLELRSRNKKIIIKTSQNLFLLKKRRT